MDKLVRIYGKYIVCIYTYIYHVCMYICINIYIHKLEANIHMYVEFLQGHWKLKCMHNGKIHASLQML